jgi:tripartite-type tricarboxylate transporter receptor subunit TctC
MRISPWLASLLAALFLAPPIASGPAVAQTYPTRPIQVIVPFTAGNVIDVLARAFTQELSAALKQPITINNTSGASGILAVNAAANAKPDGYTLLFAPQGQLTIQPHLKKDLGYKFDTFKPICQLFDNVFAIIVARNSPIRTFQDLVDRARAKPGALTWATSGTATVSDLQMSELLDRLGLKLVHVAYRNYGQMIQDTAGGNFDFAVSSVGSFSADTVHMVALLADKRVPLFPDLVTIGELGYPGSLPGFSGLFAPAAAPPEVIDRLSAICPTIAEKPALQQIMKQVGVIPAYLPGDKFTERLIEDSKQKAKQIKAMGLDKGPK